MKKMPKISVLMPVFNEEQYLSEAIDSVLKQTMQDFEIIIVDDISTDNTIKIAQEYAKKDKRIKVFKLAKKGYRSGALNEALKHAKGEFIAFLDGDDLYEKDKLEKQIEFFREHHNIDMIYSNMETFGDEEKKILEIIEFRLDPKQLLLNASKRKDLGNIPPHRLIYHQDQQHKYIPGASVMLKNKVFDKCKFDEKLKTAQDYDLWYQIIGAGFKLKGQPIVTYKYRMHPNQISKNSEKTKKSAKYINQKLKEGLYFK